MQGRTDLRAFRAGLQRAADAETRRRAFLRPLETAKLERVRHRSPEDLAAERAVCQAVDQTCFPGNTEPDGGSRV